MMTAYVKETDDELRARSNRTYARILAGLDGEVARRYGHAGQAAAPLEQQLQSAVTGQDWERAAALSALLARRERSDAV
jgi:hypothetical protein